MKEMASDQIAGAVERLAEIAENIGQQSAEVRSYSSVYGRFWVVPRSVREALRWAEAVRQCAATGGVQLGMGVTVGRIEVTEDLLKQNVAGMAINHAARLAFLDGNDGRIAVDEEVVSDATDAGQPYTSDAFSTIQSGKVKRTELHYHWLERPAPAVATAPSSQVPETLAQVVVYDIARFSEKPQRDLVSSVEDLRHAVRRSLESTGLARWTDAGGLWYAPAGDGGVIVFGPERSRAAWSFAQALLAHTADRVPIRIGIASGIVVVVDKNLPVGKGVLQADRLSGLAEVGQPCVSKRFWKSLEDYEKRDCIVNSIPEDDEAFKVHKRGAAEQASQQPATLASEPFQQAGAVREPVPALDRRALVRFLSQLAPPSWATYLASVDRAAAYVSQNVTVAEQAAQLIRWAESSTGPGLEVLWTTAKEQFPNFR
jgi:class 3 adenylate cyclase